MTRSELRERLRAEVLRGNHEGFTDLTALTYPVTYDTGRPNEPRFIQTEVTVLEKTPQYIHLAVAVSDGGVSAFAPVTEDPEDPGPRGPRPRVLAQRRRFCWVPR